LGGCDDGQWDEDIPVKTIKNILSRRNYDVEPVDDKEQDKYLRQIAHWVGRFVFEFNDLENVITNLAAEHIDGRLEKNDYAYIFLSGMLFNQKVELLERYYHFQLGLSDPAVSEALRKKAEAVIADLKAVGKIRNTIVHANYYSLDMNGNVKEKTKFSGSDVEEYWVAITRDFLVENINRVFELIERVEELDEGFY
jgi:hypothetical protein